MSSEVLYGYRGIGVHSNLLSHQKNTDIDKLYLYGKELPDLTKYPNLLCLYLGDNFDSKLDYIPDSLETLIFGLNYKHIIPKWPENLSTLVIGSNQDVKIWPPGLKNLGVRGGYYVPDIPDTVEILNIFDFDNQSQIHKIPKSLCEVNIYKTSYKHHEGAVMNTQLYFGGYYITVYA